MSGAATVDVTDPATLANIPVDGIDVPAAPPNPVAGHSIRQTMAVGDGRGSTMVGNVDVVQPGTSDPAQIVRGYVSIEDAGVPFRRVSSQTELPPFVEAATGRVRCTIDAIAGSLVLATVSTVGTINTVSNLASVGGNDAKQTIQMPLDAAAWAQLVRGRIV